MSTTPAVICHHCKEEHIKGDALCIDWTGNHQKESCIASNQGRMLNPCSMIVGNNLCGNKYHCMCQNPQEKSCEEDLSGRTKGPWWGGWKSVHSNHEVGLRAFKQEIVGEYAEVVSNQTNANTLTQPPTVFYNSRLLISCKAVGGKVKDTVAFWDQARTVYLITHKNANKQNVSLRSKLMDMDQRNGIQRVTLSYWRTTKKRSMK